ncbi:hypothetical protein EJ06DRAFT_204784 [Trichodelitschia bisporula]|uniref:Uncharacterized protein n=1 Tax=Trichodelitschia bisporula TaxID=703511 RepID=A0A6G1I822_9PEZI|nr:hypothetical protein EJ06DRAFT_204784 [Trichodelitschia bisporula]
MRLAHVQRASASRYISSISCACLQHCSALRTAPSAAFLPACIRAVHGCAAGVRGRMRPWVREVTSDQQPWEPDEDGWVKGRTELCYHANYSGEMMADGRR